MDLRTKKNRISRDKTGTITEEDIDKHGTKHEEEHEYEGK